MGTEAANMDSAHESLKPARKAEPFTCYVLIMGMGFFGIFMAFNTAQALQSTLNKTLGNACLCTLYGTFTVACLVGPLVVDRWGPKISMIVGASDYLRLLSFRQGECLHGSEPQNVAILRICSTVCH